MKSDGGLSSRMSSYQYPAKKNIWKWTPGKIAAFSMFGFMMAGLLYFESTSGRSSYESSAVVNDEVAAYDESTDFDKEYQEFLKKGTKIISQETLDSIEQHNVTVGKEQNSLKAEKENTKSSKVSDLKQTNSSQSSTKFSEAATRSNAKTVENNLQPIELTPTPIKTASATNQGQNAANQNITGSLTEINPERENAIDTNPAQELDKTITEEFYIEETIIGTISTASDRTPLSGVSITVKGTNHKTVSDSNGKYTINVPGDPQRRTLRYTYQDNTIERDVAPGTEIVNIRF